MSVSSAKRRFQLVLIKPSHYDDEGRVIQRAHSSAPANSLACLYALALDASEREVLGPDIAIDITAVDETNTRFQAKEIVAQFERHGGYGMVGLIGVQSTQMSRALDIARPLRRAGLPVVIGGSPVSGPLEILQDTRGELRQALDMGCSLFAGDAENGRIDKVICDAADGTLQSVYRHVDAVPALVAGPSPFLPPEGLKRMIDHYASFDADRGCPFQCSFCSTNAEPRRKTRRHLADDVEQSIRAHYREGVPWLFIADDNFARNKDWEQVFDRIILLRERDKIELNIVIQIDALSHKITNFVEKAARAGIRKVFIQLDDISSLGEKRQKKDATHRSMVTAWTKADVVPYEGRFFVSPHNGLGSARDRETEPLEFFCYAALSAKVRRAQSLRSAALHG